MNWVEVVVVVVVRCEGGCKGVVLLKEVVGVVIEVVVVVVVWAWCC